MFESVNQLETPYQNKCSVSSASILLTAILLSLADAGFSLKLINFGAREMNPIMRFYMAQGPEAFVLFKCLLTTSSMLFLLVNQEESLFGCLKIRTFFMAAPFLYSMVILYHMTLFLTI